MQFPFPPRLLALAASAMMIWSASVRAVEIEPEEEDSSAPHELKDIGTRVAAPEIAPASDEGREALQRMKLPAGLKASLWAAEPMLANPVAFNFDEQGRMFVAETYRYRTSVLDIRDYMWMLEDDLASRSIDDRMAEIRGRFGPAGVKELSIESERVRLLEDRDHDGVADFSTIYAEGFNSPLDGIGSGVLARRGQVWFTDIPSLWKFTGREHAATREELSRGYGIRFNYTGHDLHGLTFGPDGKIYFSVGDRAANATAKDGSRAVMQDTGSVFRCNPDGTQLEIFAYGLRNPQSLLFTENGDLFTGDNDSDQGDEERLVHVVEDGDSGWRIGYQFAPLGHAGPWNSEKMWHPRFTSQAAYIIPPICNIEDGPSGIAYYPGTGLNESYRGTIFITHFKGSITSSGIYAYNVKPDGANYAIADAKPFLTFALPTDVKFGPDGRLYYSDWAEGWPKSKKGRIYAIYDPKHVNDPLVKETQAVIASDFTKKSADELAHLLGHADWRVRLEAQYTLAERGAPSIATLAKVASATEAPPFARRHAIWGLGQIGAHDPAALAALPALLHDADSEVRAQAAKVLGDDGAAGATDELIAALEDGNNRVKFFAAQSLGKLRVAKAAPALLAALRANDDKDNYLRHACVMGLVGGKNLDALAKAENDPSRAVRLGVILAYRRLGRAEVAKFLHDADPLLVREAALAINGVPIAAAFPALADFVNHPVDDEPVMLRAINANFRLGGADNATALANYAARGDAPEALRAEALTQLSLWPKPPARDRVVGVFRPLSEKTRDAAPPRVALARVVPALLTAATPESVGVATAEAVAALEVRDAGGSLMASVRDSAQPSATRAAALETMEKLGAARLADAVAFAGTSDAPVLRLAALPIAARISPEAAAPLLERLATSGTVDERRAAYKALAGSKAPLADRVLAEQLKQLAAGTVPPGAQLELVEAAQKRSDPTVRKLLADRDAAMAASGDPLAPFRVALEGGNARRAIKTFMSQPVMACVRCHNAGYGGGEAGPNLSTVGARHTREYLLESIVRPNAKIAAGFDSVLVTLKSGAVIGGTVESEAADILNLRNADGKIVAVKKADITKRESAPSAMPEIYGTILTKAEIRDLVELLINLKSAPEEMADSRLPRALRHWDDN
ncbi:MAG TPA: HEAT repeat domain-containing protein [Opitutus sp.]|nr:HEAT repeat domain-containing protein [Opitutus sp.]